MRAYFRECGPVLVGKIKVSTSAQVEKTREVCKGVEIPTNIDVYK